MKLHPDGASPACFKPDRRKLTVLSTCNNCGIFLWYYPNVKRGQGFRRHPNGCCSSACAGEYKRKLHAKRANPLGIDMHIDTDANRSACAVIQCDIINRCRDEILDRLGLDGEPRRLMVEKTDQLRKRYLAGVKCMPTHGRHIQAAGLVFVAGKALDAHITRLKAAEVGNTSPVTITTMVREIEKVIGQS